MPVKKSIPAQKKTGSSIIKNAVKSVKESAVTKSKTSEVVYNWRKTISTGSTLLDLALSGGRCEEGGVPGGILLEVFGKPSAGKSSILSEIGGSVQEKGGEVYFQDPEARLDAKYCQIYGLNIDPKNYSKPDTVTEVFDTLNKWDPSSKKINAMCVDSLAALSTNLELEKGDKMGMRRAKEFSEGLRKTCRIIEKNNWIVACSNQVRQGDFGDITPGGRSTEFYCSARIKIMPMGKVVKKKKLSSGKEIEKVMGIQSRCTIVKSSIDDPYRTADIYIVFGYGIDDVRANLQYRKDMLKETTYDCFTKTYQSMDKAIQYIEENNLQKKLKKEVIILWNEIESLFKVNRRRKNRG